MKRETAVKTPYFLVNEKRLVKNLELLKEIQEDKMCIRDSNSSEIRYSKPVMG